jgi:hypothetical protein
MIAKPAMPESDVVLDPLPLAIWPAMGDRVGHPFQDDRRYRTAIQMH